MAKRLMRNKLNQKGFTLLEIMIAMTIFTTFITTFVAIQGSNLRDSSLLREEETLQRLCQNKLNELILLPPTFQESLTLTPDTKTFEENEAYQYTVTYKRFELPDYNQMQGLNVEDENRGQEQNSSKALEKKVYDQVKKILKDALWQIQVTVTNKETKYNFTLSTWIRNTKAKIEITY
jgi:prepilin-type N-terminal cleavage/methylation domain-containing protein